MSYRGRTVSVEDVAVVRELLALDRAGQITLPDEPAAAWASSSRNTDGVYRLVLGHTRYAPLDQITAANFDDLEVGWRFKTDNLGPVPEYRFQSTPLMVDGILYSTSLTRPAPLPLTAYVRNRGRGHHGGRQ